MDEPPASHLTSFLSEDHAVYIFVTALFLLAAGIASLSEAAFFSLPAEEIERMRKSKEARDRKIIALLANPRLLLSVFAAWKYIMLILCGVLFTLSISLTEQIAVGVEAIVLTVLFVFFSIIIPKVYGTERSAGIVKALGGIWSFLARLTTPFVMPLLRMSFRVEKKLESITAENSARELEHAIELAASEEGTTEDEKEILRGIVNFGTLTVEDVMRPKSEINMVDVSLSFSDLLIYIKKSGFSRIPVYRDEAMNIIDGILYIKDLLPFLKESKKFQWQKLLRRPYFVPQSKKIDMLLKEFQEKRVHIALAIDENSAVSGIITLEDIIEEIIGDIHDEFDEVGSLYKWVTDYVLVVDAKIPVSELCRVLDTDADVFETIRGENETLGGVLHALQQELPRIGDKITLGTFQFTIEAVDHKRIKKIKVELEHEKQS